MRPGRRRAPGDGGAFPRVAEAVALAASGEGGGCRSWAIER